jgi:aspartokinase-like uncharacterized kinase
VKVGGSLLDYAGLPKALARWRDAQPQGVNVWLAGGGPLADAIRRADGLWRLGETTAHWLCIGAMSVTSRLLAALLPDALYTTTWSQLQAAVGTGESRDFVFDVAAFLRDEEPHLPGMPLPCSWNATSDSIAARVAEVLAADELVLLKSRNLPAAATRHSAEGCRFVDEHFSVAAAKLPVVRCVNLRSASLAESRW